MGWIEVWQMKVEEAEIVIEALIFAATRPIGPKQLGDILDVEPELVARLVDRVRERYDGRGIQLRSVAGGYQFVSSPECGPWLEQLGRPMVHSPLTLAGVETLAIVAYKQPITKAEIEQIRGVRVDSAVNTLLERDLIVEVGRKDGPGRPILYGTTEQFLVHFGLRSLADLPPQENFAEAPVAEPEEVLESDEVVDTLDT